MRRQNRTKIVATIGPGTGTPEAIKDLFEAGVDVFRLNFSHGAHSEHKERLDAIRALERQSARPIAAMMDLQGPKLRIGTFKDGPIQLEEGARFRLDLDETPGDITRATLPHPEIFAALEPGADLLLDDGKVRLTVVECGADFAECSVAVAGPMSERKGVNVPGVLLPLSPLT